MATVVDDPLSCSYGIFDANIANDTRAHDAGDYYPDSLFNDFYSRRHGLFDYSDHAYRRCFADHAIAGGDGGSDATLCEVDLGGTERKHDEGEDDSGLLYTDRSRALLVAGHGPADTIVCADTHPFVLAARSRAADMLERDEAASRAAFERHMRCAREEPPAALAERERRLLLATAATPACYVPPPPPVDCDKDIRIGTGSFAETKRTEPSYKNVHMYSQESARRPLPPPDRLADCPYVSEMLWGNRSR